MGKIKKSKSELVLVRKEIEEAIKPFQIAISKLYGDYSVIPLPPKKQKRMLELSAEWMAAIRTIIKKHALKGKDIGEVLVPEKWSSR